VVTLSGAAARADLGSSSNYSGEKFFFTKSASNQLVEEFLYLKVEVEKVSSSMEIK
jgi:hypothetical protein